ncbi:hypothetical protein C5C36_06155 [Rathayibacter sp. AY1G1]|jgi:hypothetical protein|uniref:hypothetical protein n=1 Tax=unclassified Rathayibacter TaxID=2609250 RepID=UPI000CE73043|nr:MULTISPECIES: hypothetical protein [unclassified Rathayibacter]PPF09839.1 hypothetical protein C5B98_14430 [Rathayibacter sp. AY1A5]PPF44295.1 hypothetical protein C5E14_13895 [Rathayibacter sp. AY1A1]PPF55301.1 hypothetical protein C5C55_10725 [Rathayibacter sp. AY1C2]PPF67988.1 hypothetical protein C5C46_14935 [Rathayibacter sp. AY1E6]PPG18933.1 hypothetical protein C5C74_08120 [Rathayibacter sp. AY1E8]
MAISRTTRNALDLIDAIRIPGRIDPRLARQVTLSLRQLLESGAFGPSERLLRRRARRLRSRTREAAAFRQTRSAGCTVQP